MCMSGCNYPLDQEAMCAAPGLALTLPQAWSNLVGLIYLLPSYARGKIGCDFGTQSILAQGHLCPRSSDCPQIRKSQSLPPFCPSTSGSLCRSLKTKGNLTL